MNFDDYDAIGCEQVSAVKAELQRAFATPDEDYVYCTADEVIERNLRRLTG